MLLNEERLNAELRTALQQVSELKAMIANPENFDS
jgi:hypothetical protein